MNFPIKTPISAREAALVAQQANITVWLAAIEAELYARPDTDWNKFATRRDDDKMPGAS